MTDDEIRIAIAESVGWTSPYPSAFPNYPNDLNAMHDAERKLTGAQCLKYCEELNRATKCFEHITPVMMIFSTARQRAEAYLRTIGKWKE